MGKQVVIIGAGIAGLAAGTYLQNSGFDVTIYEQHIVAGGLSTSWLRKGYLFEGGMHWLTGSSPKLTLNKLWREVGALKDNNPIENRDPVSTLLYGDKRLNLYRDIEKLRNEFIDFAPEDSAAIDALCRDIKTFLPVHLMVSPTPFELFACTPAVIPVLRLLNLSYEAYLSRFKNEAIKMLLRAVIGTRYNALSFIYTLASFASGDCGYPKGGSRLLAQNMAKTFSALGGKIEYGAKVKRLVIEGGVLRGIELVRGERFANGADFAHDEKSEFVKTDVALVTLDARSAIDTLFTPPLQERWANSLRKNLTTEQNMFLCLGVKANLSKYPRVAVLPLAKEFEAAGLRFSELKINNYASEPEHAPAGCTAITCLLLGDSYAWWKARKADGTYKTCKEEIINRFVAALGKTIPEINGNVEVTDMATPLTYERYTGSFEGSWMSVWRPGALLFTLPVKSKTAKGVYFAGERSLMPGGLPIALWAGRRAARAICKDSGVKFISPVVD